MILRRTPNGDGWTVELERRIGVVRDDDYEGTIISTCKMRVADGPAWAGVDDRYWAEEEDGARGGVDAMQAAAEASSAFAAWMASPLRELRVYAAYGSSSYQQRQPIERCASWNLETSALDGGCRVSRDVVRRV